MASSIHEGSIRELQKLLLNRFIAIFGPRIDSKLSQIPVFGALLPKRVRHALMESIAERAILKRFKKSI